MADQRILIVEDEEIVAEDISDMLEQLGYHVIAVTDSGEEALEKIAESMPDLVLMDIHLKRGMDGVEASDQIRRHFDIPVVYVTGAADEKTLQRAKVTAPLGFVVKPFQKRDLHSSIEVALHIHGLGKKLRESEARLRIDIEKRKRAEEALNNAHDELTSVHKRLRRDYARLRRAIDERKRVESQLVQKAKMASLGELVAGIAHELNNPLGFIYANLGNMKKFSKKILDLVESYDHLDLPEKTREAVENKKEEINFDYLKKRMPEMIERSGVGADRMKKILLDLKSFSRLDAADFAEADINAAIETTLNIMHNEYKNRITMKKEFGDLPLVECYIAKLNQLFMNLLINACHAIEGKGEIRIKTETQNGSVHIEISDTGGGISEDIREKIFDPFFTTKPVGKGTGLGLSISHGIVKQHKGEIEVKSCPGKGTTFTIKIPMRLENEGLDPLRTDFT